MQLDTYAFYQYPVLDDRHSRSLAKYTIKPSANHIISWVRPVGKTAKLHVSMIAILFFVIFSQFCKRGISIIDNHSCPVFSGCKHSLL